ncbi:MAG: HAMP domain-containing histidine kinase [Ignavibacteria bacterium]|nr:HAMP domain-containing histidine kinase [Ignavibacteria bacterium]
MLSLQPSENSSRPTRATRDEILRLAQHLPNVQLLDNFISSLFDIVFVLNRQHQILLANQNLAKSLGLNNPTQLLGFTPGEVLQCVHAPAFGGCCGVSEFCRACGALKAILASERGSVSSEECRITRENQLEPLDLRIYATPLQLNGDRFTVFAVSDISHEKLRRALERMFFHDILNTVGGLYGFVELLQQSDASTLHEFKSPLLQLSRDLLEEIKSQRDLLAAENNELSVEVATLNPRSVLRDIVDLYKNHEVAQLRSLKINENAVDCGVQTDCALLRRVIGNMAKNALEASGESETVTLGCDLKKDGVEFWVHNPRFIPREIQTQIFQRSFSTKGSDRGVGTYSMKLIGERYLGGKVFFKSSPDDGTTFRFWLPLSPGESPASSDKPQPEERFQPKNS